MSNDTQTSSVICPACDAVVMPEAVDMDEIGDLLQQMRDGIARQEAILKQMYGSCMNDYARVRWVETP